MDDQTIHRGGTEMLQGYYRKNENRPALAGRASRRYQQRAQTRTEQRPGRHVIGHQDRAIVAASNANAGLMTVGEYLRGIGYPELNRASACGRETAEAYRKNHNAEPERILAAVNGRIRHSQFGYADVADLRDGAKTYGPTAAFLDEQQSTNVRELIAA